MYLVVTMSEGWIRHIVKIMLSFWKDDKNIPSLHSKIMLDKAYCQKNLRNSAKKKNLRNVYDNDIILILFLLGEGICNFRNIKINWCNFIKPKRRWRNIRWNLIASITKYAGCSLQPLCSH